MALLPGEIEEAKNALESRLDGRKPTVGLVLGSGLTAGALGVTQSVAIEASEIPHLPQPSVEGHSSQWIAGKIDDVEVIVAAGRVHRYEGLPLDRVTFGVRLLAAIGCQFLVVTNAAGGINRLFRPGTLMRITDHLNFLGDSPLRGDHHEEFGARFVDMTSAYDKPWGNAVEAFARTKGVVLESGVYAACLGPQYETPAEVTFLGSSGADAVGMSTVPEVIVARQCGLRVFGMSLISNAAAGVTGEALSHDEVIEAGQAAEESLSKVIRGAVEATSSL
ncbi:MAG: purine-nucleoside phosphorylase [Planctomycetota bacterium]